MTSLATLLAAIILTVSPQNGFAPLTVEARLTIEPSDVNRRICVSWESDQNSGSACWQLDGSSAPRTQVRHLLFHQEGTYDVVAELTTTTGTIRTVSAPVRVLERFPQ